MIAWKDRALRLLPGAAIVLVLTALVALACRDVIAAPPDRLPGTDAGLHYNWEVYTRSVLRTGRIPHWNPYQYAGMPHLANFETMVLYPPAMLLRWLPPESFLAVLVVVHFVIGGSGALFLGRLLGLGWLASLAAATAAALGGSAGTWLQNGHLLIVNSVAWLPWALGAAILTVRRRTLLPHPLLPVVMLLQFLAGYPQGTLYVTAVVAFYFLYSAVWPEASRAGRWLPLAQLSILGLLTLGLTAFQFFPLVRITAEAARTMGLSYEEALLGEWTLRDLATFFAPGRPESERTAYVGWMLACLVPLAFLDRSRRRIVIFLAMLTAGAVALALGDTLPLYRLHHALFPGFRIPGRALFVATLCLAMLGAIGLGWLVTIVTRSRARPIMAATILGFTVAAGFVIATIGAPTDGQAGSMWPALFAVGALGAVVAVGSHIGPSTASIAACIVIAAEMTTFAAAAVRTIPADTRESISRSVGPPDGGRAITLCEQRVPRGAFSLAERPSISGPLGMNLRGYVDWLSLVDRADRPSDRVGRFPIRRDLLDTANVSTIVACEPLEAPALTLTSEVDSVRVYRNDAAWPRAIWICDAETMGRTEATARLRLGRYESTGRLVSNAIVTVRWRTDLDDQSRGRLEIRYGLTEGAHRDGPTWRYVLRDVAPANVLALVRDPSAVDTHGVDRQTGAIADSEEASPPSGSTRTEMVIGTVACADRGRVDVVVRDQPDGRVVADVEAPREGVVFLAEPRYPERLAFVDGRPVDAVTANLAFTAVPVPAGRHQIELRMIPRSFHAGLVVSLTTTGLWVAGMVFVRRRSGAGSP